MPDFIVINHGSIVLLEARSDEARLWADLHLPVDRLIWGKDGNVVEPRFLPSIIEGILDDELDVALPDEFLS